jgi:hypothetical protein
MEEELQKLYDKKKYSKMCDRIMVNHMRYLNVEEYKANRIKMEREILLHRGIMTKENIVDFINRWINELNTAKKLKYNTND